MATLILQVSPSSVFISGDPDSQQWLPLAPRPSNIGAVVNVQACQLLVSSACGSKRRPANPFGLIAAGCRKNRQKYCRSVCHGTDSATDTPATRLVE